MISGRRPDVQGERGVDARTGWGIVRCGVVALLALVGAAVLFVGSTPLANLLAMPLWAPAPDPARADVAVVLSGGRYDDGSLNEAALERTVTAVVLYHRGLAPRLLFTGGPCCGRSASALMAALAADLGVPKDAILLEEQSTRTRESAVNAAALLRQHGWRSVILVTSPLHMLRARLAFAAIGVPVEPVLASTRNVRLVSSVPERLALMREVLHEYLGLALYRIRRWI
jgi:uncharacterized SAM-binding protein YcdF (DUF218 family)